MARIKAKPMNRLPIPPVPSIGAAIKNGYRTTPALYDPNTFQGQQRGFMYNGSSVAPSVNYGSQVHVYVSIFLIVYYTGVFQYAVLF